MTIETISREFSALDDNNVQVIICITEALTDTDPEADTIFSRRRDQVGSWEFRGDIQHILAPLVEWIWREFEQREPEYWQSVDHVLPCFDFSFVPITLDAIDRLSSDYGYPDRHAVLDEMTRIRNDADYAKSLEARV